MINLKTVILSLGSALIGGLIVAGVILWNPSLIPEDRISGNKMAEKDPLKLVEPPTEKDLIESIDRYHDDLSNQFDSFFNDDFFNQDDPFDAMRKFRQRIKKDMKDFNRPSFSEPFDTWFGKKFGGGTVQDIEKREDEDFVYYDIRVKNAKGTTINTKVENGYLTVTGQIESKDTDKNEENDYSKNSVFSSTFSRTFPLPSNIDERAMNMEYEDDKIVIKFPKTKV